MVWMISNNRFDGRRRALRAGRVEKAEGKESQLVRRQSCQARIQCTDTTVQRLETGAHVCMCVSVHVQSTLSRRENNAASFT